MRIKGTNSIGFRDIAKAGNLVINGDTTITDSGIYAKGSITINGNGITIIDNPAVANTVPTAVDTTLATPLKKIFDLNKIETGFDIATTLGQNLNEFRTIKARDIDAIGQTVARDAKGNIIKDPVTGKPMTVAQVAQLPSTDARYISALGAVDADNVNPLSKYNDLQSAWGNGGWGTIVLTSLAGAANGNVTGGTAQLVQNSAINTIQQFAIQGNKALAANINNSLLSAGVKNLLHTIVNCGAAEMKGGSCGTAAGATAATVALNALFIVPVKTMSESEKLAYSNLIQTILAGVATGANVNAAEAVFSGKAEVENNNLGNLAKVLVQYLAKQAPKALNEVRPFLKDVTQKLGSKSGELFVKTQKELDDIWNVLKINSKETTQYIEGGVMRLLEDGTRLIYRAGSKWGGAVIEIQNAAGKVVSKIHLPKE